MSAQVAQVAFAGMFPLAAIPRLNELNQNAVSKVASFCAFAIDEATMPDVTASSIVKLFLKFFPPQIYLHNDPLPIAPQQTNHLHT